MGECLRTMGSRYNKDSIVDKRNESCSTCVSANPYDTSAADGKSSSTDASAMAQMDPAWLAYYQSMSYYSMMQAGMTGTTSSGVSTSTTTTATDSTATGNSSSTTPGKSFVFDNWPLFD